MAAATNQKQCFDMLVIRLMHIADMPSLPDILKNERVDPPRPAPVVPQPKKLEIRSASELADALENAREMLLYSYFTKNIEVSDFSGTHISYFDRANDADFQPKLVRWLNDKTGENWVVEKIEKSEQNQTVGEQELAAAESDPMVADAMSLFDGAEIVGVSKQ